MIKEILVEVARFIMSAITVIAIVLLALVIATGLI